jgi:hypothetical protein
VNLSRFFRFNTPTTLLLFSNLLSLILALVFHWPVLTILWGYWLQSIIIGVFTFIKIIMIRIEEYPPIHPQFRLHGYAFFFAIHYSIFHIFYAAFLIGFSSQTGGVFGHLQPPNFLGVTIVGALFFINHTYSFIKYYILDRKQIRFYAKTIFFEPYARIIPIHLSLFAAAYFVMVYSYAEPLIIAFFLLLKTLADVILHRYQHMKDK